jgi:carbon-monoxide dehydrogenase large subunit
MAKYGIGQPVSRFEDPRLLRGRGHYQDDRNLPGQAHAVFLRSPHAHARIGAIDIAAAAAAPGVLAVYTGEDVARDGLGTMAMRLARKRPDGAPMFARPYPGLARERVRHVGDPVAMLVAESLARAKDAAELVAIAYEPLPAVTDTWAAVSPGAPSVWDECPDNISNLYEAGHKTAADAAFAGAAHIVRRRYPISRVYAHYMEPRGAIGAYDPGEDRYTLYADCQYPHRVRNALATNIFKVPESKIRVISGDVGGGFGTKGWQYVEHRLVLWAARRLGRPVKWTCERSEGVLADEHARDNLTDAELALDAEGRFLGLRVRTLAGHGAYLSSERNLLPTFANVHTLTGVYAIPAAHVAVRGVYGNKNPVAPYRGAGRPESIYVIERLIDDAARQLGLDPAELRRRNLISDEGIVLI